MDITFTQFIIAFGITAAAGLATVLGSVLVFTSRVPSPRMLAFGLSFAGGAMVFISLSEILNKSIQSFSLDVGEKMGFTYGILSFLAGILLIAAIDHFIPNPHETLDEQKVSHIDQNHIKRVGLMTVLAITAHNFPEGLATFFATLENPQIGLPLALAIALHNIPEGISIAIPIYFATQSKTKALWACFLSGLAEPVGALIGFGLLASFLSDAVFGGVFGLIAGIMVFLALDELLPAAKRYARGHETVYGLVSGMVVMALSLILFKL
jgi:ZIP family zinc transporter